MLPFGSAVVPRRKRDVEPLECLVEQVLLPGELDHLDKIISRSLIQLATIDPWIDKRLQPDPGHGSRFAGCHVPDELGHGALWEVVGLDLVRDGQFTQLGGEIPVASDDLAYKSVVGKMVQPLGLAVSHTCTEKE